ncbi:hypothetical protein GCK32_018263 [Trichostrongylus colubriformis]|uniref:Uncharacterized protein n=1 Tax=Trichostrongylus colubriformis TaxID=6319 RepID=A0AAN8IMG6_TRICO
MNNKYQEFLANKSREKVEPPSPKKIPKPLAKLLKREEMRKKGIFVEADNEENDYSWMEKVSGSRPYVCKKRTKKLKWKKKHRPKSAEMNPPNRRSGKQSTMTYSNLDYVLSYVITEFKHNIRSITKLGSFVTSHFQ